MSTDQLIALEFCGDALAFTATEIAAARGRAKQFGFGAQSGAQVEALVDSQRMSELLGVPKSHLEELGRQARVPSVRVGAKYIRYQPSAVIAAFTTNEGVKTDGHHEGRRRPAR